MGGLFWWVFFFISSYFITLLTLFYVYIRYCHAESTYVWKNRKINALNVWEFIGLVMTVFGDWKSVMWRQFALKYRVNRYGYQSIDFMNTKRTNSDSPRYSVTIFTSHECNKQNVFSNVLANCSDLIKYAFSTIITWVNHLLKTLIYINQCSWLILFGFSKKF